VNLEHGRAANEMDRLWVVGQKDVREEGQMNQDNGEEYWRDGNPGTFSGWLRKLNCGDAGPSSLLPRYSLQPHDPARQSKVTDFLYSL